MLYNLVEESPGKLCAYTYLPGTDKAYSYIRTKVTIQNNSTGKTLLDTSVKVGYVKDKLTMASITSTNYGTIKLAAWSCHEVVGKQAYACYKKATF